MSKLKTRARFSIHGAFPGLDGSDLCSLGWGTTRSKNFYLLGKSEAVLQDGKVDLVSGDALYSGKRLLLRARDVVGPNRREIFEALSLPILEEEMILGPRVAPQCIEFNEWGLSVLLQGDVVQCFQLNATRTYDTAGISNCTLSKPRVQGGTLRSCVQLHPRLEAREAERFDEALSIGGICPRMPREQLLASGWKLYARSPCDSYYSSDSESIADVENGVVRSIAGSHLLSPQGSLLLESGKTVSPSRKEIFVSLGLPFTEDFAIEYFHQPPTELIFEDWGLSFRVSEEILSISLKCHKGLWPVSKSPRRYAVKTPLNSLETRIISFLDNPRRGRDTRVVSNQAAE